MMRSLNGSLGCVLVCLAAVTACGKNESSSPRIPVGNPGSNSEVGGKPQIAADVDERILGTWTLLEAPLKFDDGTPDSSTKARGLLIVAKDKLTVKAETFEGGKLVCSVEASTEKFALTKDKLVIGEELKKENKGSDDFKCNAFLEKGDMTYVIESDDVVTLKSTTTNESLKVSRLK